MRSIVAACVLSFLCAARVTAQTRIDVGLLLGSTKASDEGTVLQFGRATTYQATFAWKAWERGRVAVAVEVPFIASPAFEVTTAGKSLPKEYASLYLTPGLRMTVGGQGPVSVFGAAGGGYTRYSESRLRVDGSPNPAQQDTNTDAIQFGGGANVRGIRW